MKLKWFKNKNLKGNSTFAIASGCAVAFMFIVTIVSIILYQRRVALVGQMVSDDNAPSVDKYVIFISEDDDSDYWSRVYEAAAAQGEKYGIYVDRISSSLNGDYTKEELLEMAIYSGCDGIFIEGDDTPELSALLDTANDMDIPVISMDSDCDQSDRISYVGINTYSIAKLYAAALKNINETDENVLILKNSNLAEERSSIIINGIQEEVNYNEEKNFNFSVGEIDSKEAFSTEEYVRNLFLSGDLPDVIICLDELTTTCVYQALIDYNMVGAIRLLGYYKSDTILQGINQGVIDGTVDVETDDVGSQAVEAFNEYETTGFVSDYISIDANYIGSSNVADYLEVEDD